MSETADAPVAATADAPRVRRKRGAGGRPRRLGVTEAVLEAAIALAAEGEGIAQLTLDAIAARAGVGRPTIYRRWPSKDALLEEVFARVVLVAPDYGNVRDDLIEWVRVQAERVQSPLGSLWKAYFNRNEGDDVPEILRQAKDRNFIMVRRGIERGELLPDTDPQLVMDLIFGMIWFQVMVYHRSLDPSFPVTLVDTVLNSCWAAESPAAALSGGQAPIRSAAIGEKEFSTQASS